MDTAQLSGRDLDHAIAEKVMGWRLADRRVMNWNEGPDVWLTNDEENPTQQDFRPSDSVDAAMWIVEELRDPKRDRYCEMTDRDGQWEVLFWEVNETLGVASAATLPEAICRAALAAIEGS